MRTVRSSWFALCVSLLLMVALGIPLVARAAQPLSFSITVDKAAYLRTESMVATIHMTPVDVDATLLVEAAMGPNAERHWRIDVAAGTSVVTPTLPIVDPFSYSMFRLGVYDLTVTLASGLDGWEPIAGRTAFQLHGGASSPPLRAFLPAPAVPGQVLVVDITVPGGGSFEHVDVMIDGYPFLLGGQVIEDGHDTYDLAGWDVMLQGRHLAVDGGHLMELSLAGWESAYVFFWVGKNPPAVGPVRINGGATWTGSLQVTVSLPGKAAPGPTRLSNVGRVGSDGSLRSGRTLPYKAKLPWKLVTRPAGPTWPLLVYAQWKKGARWSPGAIDWIRYDWEAPKVTDAPALRVLGPTATAGRLQVAAAWKASDRFGRLKSTELQVSLNGGAWKSQPVLKVPFSFRILTIATGATVKIRIRVSDAAGHRTGWVVSPPLKALLPAS